MEDRAIGSYDAPNDDALRFLRELRQLRATAGLAPTELAARAHYPRDVIVAAEAGPALPDLPVLSAYVRGCGAGLADWEERWRSITGSPAAKLCLPTRPAGCSDLASAGARLGTAAGPAMPNEDQRRIMAAISRAGMATAAAAIPAQPPATDTTEVTDAMLAGILADVTQGPGPAGASDRASAGDDTVAATETPGSPPVATPEMPGPRTPAVTGFPWRASSRQAALRYRAVLAGIVAAIVFVAGVIVLLVRSGFSRKDRNSR